MAVNQPGQHDSTTAIQFFYFAFVFPEPRMLENLALQTSSNDFAATAKNGRVFDDSDFSERPSATRRILPTQGYQLANIGQQKVGRFFGVCHSASLILSRFTFAPRSSFVGPQLHSPVQIVEEEAELCLFLREPKSEGLPWLAITKNYHFMALREI
jgi:hypothetical protein